MITLVMVITLIMVITVYMYVTHTQFLFISYTGKKLEKVEALKPGPPRPVGLASLGEEPRHGCLSPLPPSPQVAYCGGSSREKAAAPALELSGGTQVSLSFSFFRHFMYVVCIT